jgi:GNAT superfamily N-acetyltransferase
MVESEILRSLRPEDIPAAVQLSAHAGWNQTEEDWRTLLELSPEGCLVMEVNGEVAATTTMLFYGRRLAWIGMVLTKLEYQRRGLATKLLKRALTLADHMSTETIKLDATDQGQPLYETFGFVSEQPVERWIRTGNGAVPSSNRAQSEEAWRNCDLPVFGADRSSLLRELAKRNSPSLIDQSYLFSRPGRVTAYLGPCVSDDPKTARQLVEGCIRNTDCGWSWDLFPANPDAVALAKDFGFSRQRRVTRMARGKKLRGKESAIYGIAGFELG